MKYTIKDIANLCGVGKSTVSRVLNNDPNVHRETRAKIQAMIDKLGFEPNRSARAMRGVLERVVGIIVTRLNSPAESQTLSAILQELYHQGVTPIIVESQFQPEKVKQHLRFFQQRQVDGVVVFAFSALSPSLFSVWKNALIVIARRYPNISSVFYDDGNAINTLMNHFYQQGYRHIAYVGVEERDETTGHLRTQSYLDFCRQHAIVPNWVVGDLSSEQAYQNMHKLFDSQVEAIVCATSRLAVGALKFLQKNGQKQPLAYIGHNEVLQYLSPQATCLDFGYSLAGKLAVELLNKQFEGDNKIEQRCIPFKFHSTE